MTVTTSPWSRRAALLGLASLTAGCAVTLPSSTRRDSDPVADALLAACVRAHGADAFDRLRDVSVGYDGRWAGLVQRLQPVLVDSGYRGASQDRIAFQRGPRMVQSSTGPEGHKYVLRTPTSVDVWYGGRRASAQDVREAAALVADAYRMFLTGPSFFRGAGVVLETAGADAVAGRDCDLLLASLVPGLGLSKADRVVLYIDRRDRLLRRVRFTLDGLQSTQGAIADVDLSEHRQVAGVLWPTRYVETLRAPIAGLPVHEWWVTGLDVDRGLGDADLPDTGRLAGRASAPARPFPGCRECSGM